MKREPSISLTFRDEARGLTPDQFRLHAAQKYKSDICFHHKYSGIFSFDDTSWAEWRGYEDGSIRIWAYNKRHGHPFKTNPVVLKP